jgi:AraC-like DNA-binding protein
MLFEHTSLAATASAIVDALELYGCDAEAVFRRANVDIEAIRRSGARYSLREVRRLWEVIRAETRDPAVGLAVGQHLRPPALHSLGLSWISSPTVLEGLRRFQRYAKVTSTLLRVDIAEKDGTVRFAICENDDEIRFAPEGVDLAFCGVVGFCRAMTNAHFAPLEVVFCRPDNGRIDRYIEIFKCPIRFSAGENAMYFDAEVLSRPAPAGNHEIAYANDRITEQYLASLDPELLQDKVRENLVSLLPSGKVSQRLIARNLHRSVSALQKQLKAEGVSFREILDETRAELAQRLVREQDYTLAEITYLLGFADQANFSRAFKRWFGDTPSVYRMRARPRRQESSNLSV